MTLRDCHILFRLKPMDPGEHLRVDQDVDGSQRVRLVDPTSWCLITEIILQTG